jgi:hypothetical protein
MTPTDPPAATRKRGADLLLEHVLTLDGSSHANARDRLEASLGRDLSTLLVAALTTQRRKHRPL